MDMMTIGALALLALVGLLVFGLESGVLADYKGAAVAGMVLLSGVAIAMFFMNDSEGKIDWGDRMENEAQKCAAAKLRAARAKARRLRSEAYEEISDDLSPAEACKKGAAAGGADGSGDDAVINETAGQDGESGKGKAEGNSGGSAVVEETKSNSKKTGGGNLTLVGADENAKKTKPEDEIKTFQDCDVCPIMVKIDWNVFNMGAGANELGGKYHEGPKTRTVIGNDYGISQFEITRQQFEWFLAETKYRPTNECIINGILMANRNYRNPGIPQDDKDPVVCVNWNDAKAYGNWLAKKTKGLYRLASEAEWEYAARGKMQGAYSIGGGGGIDKMDANYGQLWKGTSAVGSFHHNRRGLYDVHGNVAEWTEDCWHDTVAGRPWGGVAWMAEDSGDCSMRAVRGGSWLSDAEEVRSASRAYDTIKTARNTLGIRVVKQLTTNNPASGAHPKPNMEVATPSQSGIR